MLHKESILVKHEAIQNFKEQKLRKVRDGYLELIDQEFYQGQVQKLFKLLQSSFSDLKKQQRNPENFEISGLFSNEI